MASSVNAGEESAGSSGPSSSQTESTIRVKIMSLSSEVPRDLSYTVQPSTTINALKDMIKESLESRPSPERQRLIFRGKLLQGQLTVQEMLIGVEVSSSLSMNSAVNNR
jgi:hypothetical protein